MAQILKDLISSAIYIFLILFQRNRKAVLVYHSADEIDSSLDPLKINIKPRLFEKQIKYLSRFKDKYIVTFDDGFESVYTNALPILKKYNMGAILFITTDFIDRKINLDHFFEHKYFQKPLSWGQIKEICSLGIKIGSHSLTHRNMAGLDKKSCYEEASFSKNRIESEIGCKVDYFSYPFGNKGSFSNATEKALRSVGYKKAYTNIMGMDNSTDEPFVIRRIRIYSSDNMLRFKMKIAGAYNWVDWVIHFLKRK